MGHRLITTRTTKFPAVGLQRQLCLKIGQIETIFNDNPCRYGLIEICEVEKFFNNSVWPLTNRY